MRAQSGCRRAGTDRRRHRFVRRRPQHPRSRRRRRARRFDGDSGAFAGQRQQWAVSERNRRVQQVHRGVGRQLRDHRRGQRTQRRGRVQAGVDRRGGWYHEFACPGPVLDGLPRQHPVGDLHRHRQHAPVAVDGTAPGVAGRAGGRPAADRRQRQVEEPFPLAFRTRPAQRDRNLVVPERPATGQHLVHHPQPRLQLRMRRDHFGDRCAELHRVVPRHDPRDLVVELQHVPRAPVDRHRGLDTVECGEQLAPPVDVHVQCQLRHHPTRRAPPTSPRPVRSSTASWCPSRTACRRSSRTRRAAGRPRRNATPTRCTRDDHETPGPRPRHR